MKNLSDYISEGAGHIKSRLGGGSSGVAYDLGNGTIRKTLRVSKGGPRKKDAEVIEKWAKTKNLKVIAPIWDVDYDGYTMEKFSVPCEEGVLIEKVLFEALYDPDPASWKEDRIQKAIDLVGKEKAQWVMDWLKDFYEDAVKIMGHKSWSDDLRRNNIGTDKHGNVKCFDWFDPFC